MVLPVKPVVYPAFLNNAVNGKIDINRLSKIHTRGWLEPQTARAFKALQAEIGRASCRERVCTTV